MNEGDALFHIASFGETDAVEEEISEHRSIIEDDQLYEIETVKPPSEE